MFLFISLDDPRRCFPLLKAPKNGKRLIIPMGDIPKYISFSCNKSYALIGDSLAICNSGIWSSPTPTCEKRP